MSRYIFVTGGVLSSLGKGLTAACIGSIMEDMGYSISFLKLDPYLNVDPGTMSPHQHGEVFVTADGTETDLDLGHYERFTHARLGRINTTTSGRLYANLLEKERRGDFLGGTLQIVPHLTDEIKMAIQAASQGFDCTIVEIGGTVGDIEGLPFIEAIRQMGMHENRAQCIYIHLTYVPYIRVADEFKTKPTQHSVRDLRSLGIQPDILLCRSEYSFSAEIKRKIALFTNVKEQDVIAAPDLSNVYELPIYLTKQGLPKSIARLFNDEYKEPTLSLWYRIQETIKSATDSITIALVGKYGDYKDAYKSIYEAFVHSQVACNVIVQVEFINSETVTHENVAEKLKNIEGIVVPGGFGNRGITGKLEAIRYARENGIPFLGICLGMQLAAIEFARNVLEKYDADSTEFNEHTSEPVIAMMDAQKSIVNKGGSMRLGAQKCSLTADSLAARVYKTLEIEERHRHRYELNSAYKKDFLEKGLRITGVHPDTQLPEILELDGHPYFIACQFHPELQSTAYRPHPLFVGLVEKALQLQAKD